MKLINLNFLSLSMKSKVVVIKCESYNEIEVYNALKKGLNLLGDITKLIPIKDMVQLVRGAENSGANFIAIDYHCDHEEYEVYGVKVERLNEPEIIDLNKKKALLTKKQNEQRIVNLQASIDKLVKENLKLDKIWEENN